MATTWSTTNHGTVTLTNANLTATATGGSPGPFSGRTDASISGSQLIYGEDFLNVSSSTNDAVGFANASWTFTDGNFTGGDTFSLGYYGGGQVFVNFVQIATIGAFSQGATIGWAINKSAGLVWFTLDGATFNGGTALTQNPIGVIGGIPITITGDVFPCYQTFQSSGILGQWTAEFGATTFCYATLFTALQAAGYTSFDGGAGGDTLMGQAVM